MPAFKNLHLQIRQAAAHGVELEAIPAIPLLPPLLIDHQVGWVLDQYNISSIYLVLLDIWFHPRLVPFVFLMMYIETHSLIRK